MLLWCGRMLCTWVAFLMKNPIDLDLSDEIDQVRWKRARCQIYHRDARYYVIKSRNTSGPMIGHLEFGIGTLTSHALWACLTKISPGFDCERGAFHLDRSHFWWWTQPWFHFRQGSQCRPIDLNHKMGPSAVPLKQPNTYFNLCDLLLNLTVSITVVQSISVRSKLVYVYCPSKN